MARLAKTRKTTLTNEGTGTLSIRFDPKLRYQIELAARSQHRNLSNFIEDCIREKLKNIKLFPETLYPRGDKNITVENYIEELWDVNVPDRLAKLGILAPHLLNHEEQKIWKVILQVSWLWLGNVDQYGLPRTDILSNFDFQKLNENWDIILKVAKEEMDIKEIKLSRTEKYEFDRKKSELVNAILSNPENQNLIKFINSNNKKLTINIQDPKIINILREILKKNEQDNKNICLS